MSIETDPSSMGRRLHSATILLVRTLREADRTTLLTSAQRSVLARLINDGPHTLGELARAEKVRPPTITRLIQQLERDGYVVRKPTKDRRVSAVDYTSKAWAALESSKTSRSNSLVERIRKLNKNQQKQLAQAIPILSMLADTEDA